MSTITTLPPPNLWEQACQEVQEEREELQRREDHPYVPPTSAIVKHYDPSTHHPALCGGPFARVLGDYTLKTELDQSMVHPACASHWFAEDSVSEVHDLPKPAPDKKMCSNHEFLEHYVWPCLLPALENTLIEAKRQGCFGLKKVLFNSLDYLTEYLYNHNPLYGSQDDHQLPPRPQLPLLHIPFVQNWLSLHPRPPQPVSLTWTEDETATKIQAAWRGYLVHRDPEVQELRRWQEEWRCINREGHIAEEVSGFWDRLMPDYTSMSTSMGLSSTRMSNSLNRRRSSQGSYGRRGSTSSSASGHFTSGSSAKHMKQK